MKRFKGNTVSLLVAMILVAFVAAPTFAATAAPAPNNEFFTVDEDNLETDATRRNEYSFMEYSPVLGPSQFIQGVKKLVVNLLKWTLHEEAPPSPEEKYMRKLHFGRWINDPTDDTCMNTRAKVLVRDSNTDVTYRGNKQCVVDSGHWNDPYAGKEVVLAREIQIDHMVPLKNAYMSGAWQWDYKTRCLYANYMGYKNHLISSDASQNMSKGDRAPDRYLPANLSYRCQYVRDWLAVKLIWKLNMTMDEVQAIHEVVNNYGCKASDFRFTKAELEKQREYINANLDFCMINKR